MDRILWCLILIEISTAEALPNCPTSQYKFEKVLGLRPRDATRSLLLYKSEGNGTLSPVTAECVAKCRTDDECRSFVLYYRRSQCYYFKTDIDVTSASVYQLDNDAAWFIKTCFSTDKICDKMWVFERIPGAILIGNDTKTLPGYISRTDCQSFCLNETQFSCRSAKFKLRSSSNLGRCTLSDADRHQLPSAYRVSGYDEEYFENECTANVLHNTDFCSYEEYDNVTLTHSDMIIRKKSREDCQTLCDDLESFNCRAFSVINSNDCYLHAEDSKIFGPTMLKENSKSIYYEKARCLNLTVSCTEAYMTIKYDPELNFQGKIYMQGFSGSPQCTANGQGKFEMVTLKLPLLSSQCGVVKAEGAHNRTLLSGTLIIQYNSIIQTQSDRVIRVGCIFGNDSKVIVGTGVKISSLLPNKGSSLLNPSSNATITSPTVEMRIVDFYSHREVSDTQIGQELQLVISMKSKNSNWDIWARHLVAMTEKSDESIFLLDDRGCPTNLNIFPPLEKVASNDSKQLVASFQAFKFATSPIIRFSAIVQFCEMECPQIDCGSNVVSYGRKKREVSAYMLQTVNGTTVVRINRTDFRGKSSLLNEIPLEYIMVVRDAKSVSDRLVYGENTRVLVAGYDYSTQEVCFDYSFVIGLIVTWILVQIVFVVGCIVLVRRYKKYYQHECTTQSLEELHKNFGIGFSNLENRRVRWADNDTM